MLSQQITKNQEIQQRINIIKALGIECSSSDSSLLLEDL
jgi:hypothetical protein